MTDSDLRCGNCSHWLGEATTQLVKVGVVSRSTETTVRPPRDLRLCKACGQVTVFISRDDLETKLGAA